MPDKEVKVGPRKGLPTGSFTGSQALDRIEKERMERAIEEGERKEAERDTQEKEQTERDKEIDKIIPKTVNSSLGPIPFDRFKEWYRDVWNQVESKEHLARGHCLVSKNIHGISVSLRTFKAKEMRVINSFTPVSNPESEFGKYLEEDALYRAVQVMFGMVEFDGKSMPLVNFPTGDLVAWRESETVKARLEFIDDLPEEIVALVNATLADVTIAYRLALRENLKNQLAPL